jgi:3-hydroxyisobutyrate dehydrogenase-like beta-hydroxyacid dehydrogenase
MAAKPEIGWIGLGKMGIPMSKNLIKAGYALTVYNRTKAKTKDLAGQGAGVADSPKELTAAVDIIISMVSDDPALESLSIGPDGAFREARAGAIYIDMSTVSPEASARVADEAQKRGIKYLRAPVSGSTALATAGTLTILVSGPKDAYESCTDIFGVLGQKSFHVGTGEEARYLKLLINMMVGITSAMTAEALVLGKHGGLDWAQMIDVISSTVVASPLMVYKAQTLKDRDFTPAFTADQIAKDFDIALDAGGASNVPLPITSLVRQLFGAMKATGKGRLDYFGLVTVIEALAGDQTTQG